uniref:Sas10 C-terminal domain-containing protein n=1 Tax=Anopheles minimus TaxID=112268 RepID=A0A182VYK2_9DIPT
MPDKIEFGDVGSDYEPSASEDEYSEGEKELLKNVRRQRRHNDDEDDEMRRQAVLGFDDEADYDDEEDEEPDFDEIRKFEHDSDIDDKDEEDDLPDRNAWGSKAGAYYGTGYKDRDYDTLTAQEEELARLEEEEAMEMQKRLMKGMTEEDFGLDDLFSDDEEQAEDASKPAEVEPPKRKQKGKQPAFTSKEEIVVKRDFSDLSDRQRSELFRKDSPEFLGLVKECTDKLGECENVLEPILKLLKAHNQLSHPFGQLLSKRYELHMLYCSNISFYVLLKSQRVDIRTHPLVKRILQLKRFMQEMEQKYEQAAKAQVEALLEAQAEGMEISFEDGLEKRTQTTKKRLRVLDQLAQMDSQSEEDQEDVEDEDESDPEGRSAKRLRLDAVEEHSEEEEQPEDMEEMDADGKRKITYQMAKNKGLSARKRKDQRNIRVKNKLKFRKAMNRRKGAVRTVRTETTRYTGESNIKPFVKRGIKLK